MNCLIYISALIKYILSIHFLNNFLKYISGNLLKKNNKLIGYTRVFKNGDYLKNASIGRVLVCKNNRYHNYGTQLMEVSINAIKTKFKESKISISAQTYLKQFYSNLGFETSGEEYLEDGIPHIAMIKTNL